MTADKIKIIGKKVNVNTPCVQKISLKFGKTCDKSNYSSSLSLLWPEYPLPKLDVNFPLEQREEPWVKELEDSKEMKQLLDSKIGKLWFIDILGNKAKKN